MHIEIHIFPRKKDNTFPCYKEILETQDRVRDLLLDAIINVDAYTIGKTTLLANDDSGLVVATVDIRRE